MRLAATGVVVSPALLLPWVRGPEVWLVPLLVVALAALAVSIFGDRLIGVE